MLSAVIEKTSALLARLTAVIVVLLAIGLVGSLLISIFFRYVIGQALSWPEEISLILFTWLVLLAGSLGVREGFHVRLTILSSRLPPKPRSYLDKAITASIGVFGCVLVYSGADLLARTSTYLTATLRLPLEWINFSAPVCGGLIVLHSLAVLLAPGKEN
ncbi:MAG: TRAP transporter small permease [Deltaproteobacteria bacterium]|nr:TRAP transporter small permease [Deltaproteobacteria bacterium]